MIFMICDKWIDNLKYRLRIIEEKNNNGMINKMRWID
jgi:hypothetical protein